MPFRTERFRSIPAERHLIQEEEKQEARLRKQEREEELERQREEDEEGRLRDLELTAEGAGIEIPWRRPSAEYVGGGTYTPRLTSIYEPRYEITGEKVRALESRLTREGREAPERALREGFREEIKAYGGEVGEIPTTEVGRKAVVAKAKEEYERIKGETKLAAEQEKTATAIIDTLEMDIGKPRTVKGQTHIIDTASEAVAWLREGGIKLTDAMIRKIKMKNWKAIQDKYGTKGIIGPEPTEAKKIKGLVWSEKMQRYIKPELESAEEKLVRERAEKEETEERMRERQEITETRLRERQKIAEIRRLETDAVKAGLGKLEGTTLEEKQASYSAKLAKADVKTKENAVIANVTEDKAYWKNFKRNEDYYRELGLDVERIKKAVKVKRGWK